ncbi:MAG: ThuA domain-containing protein [Tannerella sp.]|jgi:type 1 glutamine amidotransferase|nr:ThuA domain-containing protein [Tannerella sp.]
MFSRKLSGSLYFFLLMFLSVNILNAKDPIKALIVTGQNNHNWRVSSVVLQKYLNESGIFAADMVISPEKDKDMPSFCPDFSAYSVIVLDYNGDSWSEDTNSAFLEYVKNGGGVVVYHAADNAFRNWKEYNEIIGLGGWENRDETDGPYVYFSNGKEVRDTSPGPGGNHGDQHEYKIMLRVKDHPITKGLPDVWTHSVDELYDRLRGPAKNMTILATAYSDKNTRGTGRDEPILMVLNWGKGRIFHTVLGHVGGPVHPAIDGHSFIVTFLRGTEWAATGEVTQKVPDDFPKK